MGSQLVKEDCAARFSFQALQAVELLRIRLFMYAARRLASRIYDSSICSSPNYITVLLLIIERDVSEYLADSLRNLAEFLVDS